MEKIKIYSPDFDCFYQNIFLCVLIIWLMQNKKSTETNICISHICLFSWTAAISLHFNYTWCSISFGNKTDKMSRPIDLLSWKIKQREKWNTKCCSQNSIQFNENVGTIVLFRFSILTLFYSLFLEYLPFYLKKHHPIFMLFQGKHLSKLKTKKRYWLLYFFRCKSNLFE